MKMCFGELSVKNVQPLNLSTLILNQHPSAFPQPALLETGKEHKWRLNLDSTAFLQNGSSI